MVTQSDKKKVGKRVGKLFQSLNKTKLPCEESSRSADQGLPTVVRQRVLSRARLGELEAYKGHHITAPEERGHLRGERTEGEASLPPRQRETLQTKQQEKETDKQIKNPCCFYKYCLFFLFLEKYEHTLYIWQIQRILRFLGFVLLVSVNKVGGDPEGP
jgi:hypothetical protein